MTSGTYEPGTYAKGDSRKVAKTPAQAVDLVFRGYKKVDEAPAEQAEAPQAVTEPVQAPTPRAPRRAPAETPQEGQQ